MAPPRQTAAERPISFIFHDTDLGEAPVEVRLVIRPEDLTRNDPSRVNVTQTIGGAWVDNFGKGIPTVSINGHTGWGSGTRPDGLEAFQALYQTVFSAWHNTRKIAVQEGRDPDKVKLLFSDVLDEFTWVVVPQNFTLKRNRSRPLLVQYSINMIWVSDDVQSTLAALQTPDQRALDRLGFDSLAFSIKTIRAFAQSIAEEIGVLMEIPDRIIEQFTELTADVLNTIQEVIEAGDEIIDAVIDPLINIGQNLSRAAANVLRSYQALYSFPDRVSAKFSRAASAFQNANCIFANILSRRRFLPDYNNLYGASMCSSTVGGKPISKYASENPFPVLIPVQKGYIRIASSAHTAASRLAGNDPALAPMNSTEMVPAMRAIRSGVAIQ